jgi:hypothetical protein
MSKHFSLAPHYSAIIPCKHLVLYRLCFAADLVEEAGLVLGEKMMLLPAWRRLFLQG